MIAKRLLCVVVGLVALVSAAVAWPSDTTANVVPSSPAAPVLYRLDAASHEVQGCFEPCKCPIWLNDDLVGTMSVRFDHSTPDWFDHYDVTQVNWVAGFGASAQRITGRGTYRVGGVASKMQQLVLSLSIDGAAPVLFDSGLVAGGSLDKLDVAVAMNGFFCFDRAFTVVAAPVPASELVRYRLRGASFTEGCQQPCLCPIWVSEMNGNFALVDLGLASDPAHMHYALVDIGWRTKAVSGAAARTFRGLGIYSIDAVNVEHRLVCDIAEGTAKPQRFDSGIVPGGIAFAPQIEIDMALNGFYCWDQVFGVRAFP